MEFKHQALFLPDKVAYHFNNVRYNRIHPIKDATQLVAYKRQPFFLIMLLTILGLGIMAVGLEFVYILRSKKRIQTLRRVLFINTGSIREEPALMVARGVPWIDFSQAGRRVTMQHLFHIATVHVPVVAAFLTIMPSALYRCINGKKPCWRSSDRVILESLQAGSTRIALLLVQLLAVLVSEGFFVGQDMLGGSQDVFLWLFERLFVSAIANVMSLPAFALIPEIFHDVNHMELDTVDSTQSQTWKAKLLRALPFTTFLYLFQPPEISQSSLTQPNANQVAPDAIYHQTTLQAEIVDTPLRESHKSDPGVIRIAKPLSMVKRPVLQRVKMRPSAPAKRDPVQNTADPWPAYGGQRGWSAVAKRWPAVAKPAFQRVTPKPSTAAIHPLSLRDIATRTVVWIAWQDRPEQRMYRNLMSILGWAATVFFFGYYAWLVLVFGATLSSDKMLTWLRKASVSIILSEFVITGLVLGLKLFVSYVSAKMLWTMNKNKTQPSSGDARTAGVDARSGPPSFQKRTVLVPAKRKKRRMSSRSGTSMTLMEVEI